jgi:hypothetical protein
MNIDLFFEPDLESDEYNANFAKDKVHKLGLKCCSLGKELIMSKKTISKTFIKKNVCDDKIVDSYTSNKTQFINFCYENNLLNSLDFQDIYTKLPSLFLTISKCANNATKQIKPIKKNIANISITKDTFTKFLGKYNFCGNCDELFDSIDIDTNGVITFKDITLFMLLT